MSYALFNQHDLPRDGDTYEFEGLQHGGEVSFIWVDLPPDGNVRLHQHAYQEIFIIQEGQATFTVGTSTLEAHAGQVIVVPPATPHKFYNAGPGRLRQVDIHVSKKIVTEWLED